MRLNPRVSLVTRRCLRLIFHGADAVPDADNALPGVDACRVRAHGSGGAKGAMSSEFIQAAAMHPQWRA